MMVSDTSGDVKSQGKRQNSFGMDKLTFLKKILPPQVFLKIVIQMLVNILEDSQTY
jgi:hypothetical protein